MSFFKKNQYLPFYFSSLILLSGCGSQSSNTTATSTTPNSSSTTATTTKTSTTTATTNTSQYSNIKNGNLCSNYNPNSSVTTPAPCYSFSLQGSNGYTSTTTQTPKTTVTSGPYDTDNTLIVTLTGQGAINGNYTLGVSCLQFTVTVGGTQQTALVSTTGSTPPSSGPCSKATAVAILDFSYLATPGHGPLSVTISQPAYDNCAQNYGWYGLYYSGCPLHSVQYPHVVTGQYQVHTSLTQ